MTIETSLTLESLRKTCPSIFAGNPSPKMSERYAFVSTAAILEPLLKAGYIITQADQRSVRRDGRNPLFTRHQVRLRKKGAKPVVGDAIPEVVIVNSHDGQSRFQIFGGLFRLLCLNGLVVGVAGLSDASGKLIHLGDPSKILDAVARVVKRSTEAVQLVGEMTKVKLGEKAQIKFAKKAAAIAYGDDDKRFDSKLLLAPRREVDKGDDVWTVYNRVQENIVRGGVRFVSPTDRNLMTRGITHIGRSIEINTGLWDLAVAAALPKAA